MGNLLRAELYKTIHRKSLSICLAFTITIEFLNGFLHGGNQIDTMTLLVEIIGLVTCALFAGLFIGNDFSSRTIFHTITSGKSRICVWISKYLAFFVVSFIILFVNALTINISVILFHGMTSGFLAENLIDIFIYNIAGIFYDLCLVSIFFLVTMQVKESGISIAISTVLVGVIISNSKVFWVDRMFPLFNSYMIMSNIPIINLMIITTLPFILMLVGIILFKRRDM